MPIHTLPYTPDTLELAGKFRQLPYFILLDSGHLGPDVFSGCPLEWLVERTPGHFAQHRLQTGGGYSVSQLNCDREQAIKALHHQIGCPATPESGPAWQASVMGLLSYESGYDNNYIGELLNSSVLDCALSQFGLYTWCMVVDHSTHTTQLHISPLCPNWLEQRLLELASSKAVSPGSPFHLQAPFSAHTPPEVYTSHVAHILDLIHQGDCYQVNYTQKFSAACEGDAWQAFKLLRRLAETPFAAFLDTGDEQILSHSPERFIQVKGGQMITQPIKGTVARGNSPEQDQALVDQLKNSIKDRAENLMIVDLLRNDLGKSAVAGSIKVPALFAVETYRNVHHLVSTVTGELLAEQSPIDGLLRAFPGGSITGAPKRRAMEIIHSLEPSQRGPYCGSLFYWNDQGVVDSSILIRTLMVKAGRVSVWGGGGIVSDSHPQSEFEESLTKVGYLMAALENTLAVP